VGNIAEQLPLRRQQRFDALGHEVEVTAELGNLVATATHSRPDANAQVAAGEAMRGVAQAQHRRRQVTRQPIAENAGGEEDRQHAQRQCAGLVHR